MKQVAALLLAVGCTTPSLSSEPRIEVTEPNTLGITSLEVVRSGKTFELRAFDANDNQVASIDRRVGLIPDVTGNSAGIGSEMTTTVGNASTTVTSYTPDEYLPQAGDPSIHTFLALKAVASELVREHVFVLVSRPRPAGDVPYYTEGCSQGNLLANNVPALQCCESYNYTYYWDGYEYVYYSEFYELHVVGGSGRNAGHLIGRLYNSYGLGCTQYDGYTPCTTGRAPSDPLGGDCYYGPAGFAISTDYSPSSWVVIPSWEQIFSDYTCSALTYGTPTFGTVYGTGAVGACPNGSTSKASYWQDNAEDY